LGQAIGTTAIIEARGSSSGENAIYSTRSKYAGFSYIAPALLFVAVFTLYPLGQLFWMSLHNWSLLGGNKFVGFQNYVRAYQDQIFWSAFFFTCEYTLYLTPILIILGYLFALLTSGTSSLVKLTRGIIFIPVVIGIGSSSLLWCLAVPAADRSFQ
jgi:multiple sugar transport system permease protein